MKRVAFALLLATGCLTGPEPRPRATGGAAVWEADFGRNNWLSEWNARREGRFGMDNLRVESEPGGRFPRFLRAAYYQGGASPSASRRVGLKEGGGQFLSVLEGGPVERLFLRYYVRFPTNFPFVKGGKLPGLYGGRTISGGNIPDGTNGFSTRFMWRTDGMGEVYAYLPTSATWGTSLGRGDWRFERGRWHCLEQEVVLNTPGRLDGVVRAWVDGKLAHESTRVVYRTVPTLKIEGVFFSTFFGGGDPTWAPPHDTHADFAHFAVGRERVGCD